LLRVGEIDLRVAWRSLVLFAPVVDRIRVDRPHVALVRQDIARYNFSDIIDRLAARAAGQPAEPEPADAGPPRLSLNNLSLTGGGGGGPGSPRGRTPPMQARRGFP